MTRSTSTRSNAGAHATQGPVKVWRNPHIELFEPTDRYPYYRLVARHPVTNKRIFNSGGRTIQSANAKARTLALRLEAASSTAGTKDPFKIRVWDEAVLWLDRTNHRTRRNEPWTDRHADNMEREWRLRISPEIPRDVTIPYLHDRSLWVRILNTAPERGASSPQSVQKTGAACRSFISWLMTDRQLLPRNPMQGVPWTVTGSDDSGPLAVDPREIPTMEHALGLSEAMRQITAARQNHRGVKDVIGPIGRAVQPLLVATSGIRNGEMFAVRADDVDLSGLTIRVRETLVETDRGRLYFDVPKNGKARETVFAAWLVPSFEEFIAFRRATDRQRNPLLYASTEGHLERRKRHAERFRRAAALAQWPPEFEWYGLRHLAAITMMLLPPEGMGFTLEETSRLLGHHSPDFTAKRYLNTRAGFRDRALKGARAMEAPSTRPVGRGELQSVGP